MSINTTNTTTVASDSGKLTCTFANEAAIDMKYMFNIDIADEVKKLLNKEEQLGYLPGEYTFSFANKHLSLHHKDLRSEIKNNVSTIIKKYSYENNDSSTRMNVKSDIMNYLDLLHDKHAIYAYQVICDETNNTPDSISRNELNCRLGIKFDKNDTSDSMVIFDVKLSSMGPSTIEQTSLKDKE